MNQDGVNMNNKEIIFNNILKDYFKTDDIVILDDSNLDAIFKYVYLDRFEIIGHGTYSTVYKVNDKVIKIGLAKINLEIIDHPRIIKTYIKCNIPLLVDNQRINLGVEIQDLAKSTNINEEDMFKIYCELRDDNIIWKDIKSSNVCIKDNNYCIVDTDFISFVNDVSNFYDDVEQKYGLLYTENRR